MLRSKYNRMGVSMSQKQSQTENDRHMPSSTTESAWISRPLTVCLLACICCFLWGSAFPSIKIGYSLFQIPSRDTASQILFAGIRFTLAGILVLLFAGIQRQVTGSSQEDLPGGIKTYRLIPSSGNTWKHILILSCFQTIGQYIFFYIGLAHTSGVKASIIEGTNVFVSILIASLVFSQETLTLAKVTGCMVGFAGVVLVNWTGEGLDPSLHLIGEGFIFLSTFAYAFSSALIKKFSKEDDPVLLSGWQFFVGGLFLAALGWLTGGHIGFHSLPQGAILFYLAFISAGAYTLWGVLIKYNPVSRVSVYGFMNPVFGVILSFLLLKDSSQISPPQTILALALVCTGIYIVNKKTGRNETLAPQK